MGMNPRPSRRPSISEIAVLIPATLFVFAGYLAALIELCRRHWVQLWMVGPCVLLSLLCLSRAVACYTPVVVRWRPIPWKEFVARLRGLGRFRSLSRRLEVDRYGRVPEGVSKGSRPIHHNESAAGAVENPAKKGGPE